MNKTEILRVRLEKTELSRVEKLASELGITRSGLVRELINTATTTGHPRLLLGSGK